MAEKITTNSQHRLRLYNCAEVLCHKEGRATHANYFSECVTTGVTQGGSDAQGDRHKYTFLQWIVLEVWYCSHNMAIVALHTALIVCDMQFALDMQKSRAKHMHAALIMSLKVHCLMLAFSQSIDPLAPVKVFDVVQAQPSHVKSTLTIRLFMRPFIAVSAKAAAKMVSWLHLQEDEHASLALVATDKVDPPLAKSWEHLVMVMCKARQAIKALEALQELSYMGTLPSRAVAEVCKTLVNLAGGF